MALRLFSRDPLNMMEPSWGEFGNSLWGLERDMRNMDRQFNSMYNTFLRMTPADFDQSSHQGHHHHRHRSYDVGFPDALVQNPVVTDKDGNRHLALRFDVRQFKPEEIKIRTFDDNKLEVSAKHETSDDNHRVYREYHRMCTIPEGLDATTLTSQFHPNGVLTIEAPLPAIEAPGEPEPARNEPVPIAIDHQANQSIDDTIY